MAYGSGRSRLIAEIGKEQAFEAKRYEDELRLAEEEAKKESRGASAWSGVGSSLAALGTFLSTGGDLKSTAKAWTWGGEAGKWGHRLVSDYDPEDYALTTDMGRFNVQDAYKVEDVNRQFQEAHESQFWQDIAGTGKALGTMAYLGGDSEGVPESAWKRLLKRQGTPAETFHWG